MMSAFAHAGDFAGGAGGAIRWGGAAPAGGVR